MKALVLLHTFLIASIVVLSSGLEDDEFYFQLYPSENEEKPAGYPMDGDAE